MLFSEPKIPQCDSPDCCDARAARFQCSSASRKFLNRRFTRRRIARDAFQCSSASRKFLNPCWSRDTRCQAIRFSALQRAENSSIGFVQMPAQPKMCMFQCSSASRKFLNTIPTYAAILFTEFQCSSASRKFLNQSPRAAHAGASTFQCSSASRKFLNRPRRPGTLRRYGEFQCSSASRKFLNRCCDSRSQ